MPLSSSVWTKDEKETGCNFVSFRKNGTREFQDLLEAFGIEKTRAELKKGSEPWSIGWTSYCDLTSDTIIRNYYTEPAFMKPQCVPREHFFMATPGTRVPFHVDNTEFQTWQAQVFIELSHLSYTS